MTQELVLIALLSGLLGLVWVMTLAIWDNKHTNGQTQESDHSRHSDDMQHGQSALKRQATAA